MLVLTRKADQTINIGDDIRIKILEIGNGYVKLGIEAPKEMPIYREELYEKLKQLNVEAARIDIDKLRNFLGVKDKA
ncbi:MAG: carbon storage regulator CsrA [Nitrospirae bacterium]|nr:carbon storage regulator CsrA [Nitrospirota bacterium]MCL5237215.1 carbon storage regulator CsrA [Nitrospirota bacterium]